jgi:integrase
MKEVQAIKDTYKINEVGELLEKHYSVQLKQLWSFGLNVALRISDLLATELTDIKKMDGKYRLQVTEKKTKKKANISLNDNAIAIFKKIKATYPDNKYLFQSMNSKAVTTIKPLGRSYVSAALKEVGEMIDLHIGTHSMRKTRGYHLYKKTNDISKVMKCLRHSSEATTLAYIGITQESVDQDFEDLNL